MKDESLENSSCVLQDPFGEANQGMNRETKR